MRALIAVVYLLMAGWLLVAAGLRVMLQLRAGSDLDPLPFISGALGLGALVIMLTAGDWLFERRDRRRPRRSR